MQDIQECYYFSEILEHLDLLEISYSSPFNWEENEKIGLDTVDKKRNIGVKCFYAFEPGQEIEASLNEFSENYNTNNKNILDEENVSFEIGISYLKKGEFLYNDDERFKYSLSFEVGRLRSINGFKYSQVYPVVYKDNIEFKKNILIEKNLTDEDLIIQLLLIKDRKFCKEKEYREVVHFSDKEKEILKNGKIYFKRSEKASSILILKDPFKINNNLKENKLFKLLVQAFENKIEVKFLHDSNIQIYKWYLHYLEKEDKYDKEKFKSKEEFIEYHKNIYLSHNNDKKFRMLNKVAEKI